MGYLDPATLIIPEGFYPITSITRRSIVREIAFLHGILDSCINDEDYIWKPPRNLPPGWEFTIKDFPCNPIIKTAKTPSQCLIQTDEYLEKYAGLPQSLPVVQSLFSDSDSLRSRLRSFKNRWGFSRYAIGNLKGLTNETQISKIGAVILHQCASDRPHIFGCPTGLLRYLLHRGRKVGFRFTFDNNVYFFLKGKKKKNRRQASGTVERTSAMYAYFRQFGFFPEMGPLQYHKIKVWLKQQQVMKNGT